MSEVVSLEDKYVVEEGRVILAGVQALVLLLDAARRDRRNGLRVGTIVSGYPGSPLAAMTWSWSATGSSLPPTTSSISPE